MTLKEYLELMVETVNENQRRIESQLGAIRHVLVENDKTTPQELERLETMYLARIDQAWVTPVHQVNDL